MSFDDAPFTSLDEIREQILKFKEANEAAQLNQSKN